MSARQYGYPPCPLPMIKCKRANPPALFCKSAALLFLLTQSAFAQLDAHESSSASLEKLLSDDNLLIVDIYLGKYRLARDVFVYSNSETTLIPLQPLFDALEFPILVNNDLRTAEGWFLKESNGFKLDVPGQQFSINGDDKTLASDALFASDEYDLYGSLDQLNDWFPVRLVLQKGRLRLNIVSSEQLPLEKKLQREKDRLRQQQADSNSGSTLIADSYQLLGSPVIDVHLGSELSEEVSQDGSAEAMQADFSRNLFISSDIAGFQGSFVSTQLSRNTGSEERLTFRKRPNLPTENLPGNIGYAAFGDVFGASDALVFSGDQGRGFDIEFGMAKRSTDFGKRVLEGELDPGWEVEIYRNGVFLGFQVASSDGRYHFDDVPVEYGENDFELRFYGPLGQEDVRRESINVGDQALPKGETYARLSYVDVDRSLFGNNSSQSTKLNENDAVDLISTFGQPKEQKLQLALHRGISDRFSTSLALANHLNSQSVRADMQYVQAGLSMSLPGTVIDTQFAKQARGGHASLASAQTQLGDVAVSLLQKRFEDYESDRNDNNRLKRVSELRFSGTNKLFTENTIAYSLSLNEEVNRIGGNSKSIQNNLGFKFFSGRMNVETNWLKKSDSSHRSLGTTSYIRHLGAKTSLRWSLNYGLKPKIEPSSVSASILWRAKEKFFSQFVFSSDFGEQGSNNLGFAMNYRFPRVTVSSAMLLSNSGKPSIQLSADFSLAREHRGRWTVNADSMANEGRLKARVFLDHDYDGAFSEVDEPIDGVKFLGRHDWKQRRTNNEGIVYLSGLRTEVQSNVTLENKSLADPYWRTNFTGAQIVSHPGGLQQLDVPIHVTVEAEGSLYVQGDNSPLPLAGIPISIMNASGDIVSTIVTEFDGYFLAEGLIPGVHSLEINAEALSKFNIDANKNIDFEIDSAEGVYQFESIVLEPKPKSLP
ncbi:MAG: collagen binding domain-containing protein [Pseudomonadales bacterium]